MIPARQSFRPYLIFILSSLLILGISRATLIVWKIDRITEWQDAIYILIQGVRFDIILMGIVLAIPAILTPIASAYKPVARVWFKLINFYLALIFSIILFVELSSPSFINQYDLRPDFLYVEYLKYPKEVFSTLWSAYRLPLIASTILTLTAGYYLFRVLDKIDHSRTEMSPLKAVLLTPVILLICVAAIRSTLDHRPVNPSTVAFSSDPLINMLPLSSAYSVLYAIHESQNEDSSKHPYGEMPWQKVIDIVKHEMHTRPDTFLSDNLPTLHYQKAFVQREKPLNLVVILEESLGAEYVGALGGRQITPELDKLSKQGIWFENMYATGTRSVRGIEAVITGFTPTPSRSVVKLGKSQTNFFTFAQLLAQHNYKTSFIYGGESHFDNMRRFFANNGFEKIVDENNYENPAFYGSWGASDEDLFNKAHSEFVQQSANNQPFFSLVFTSSNHPPFDYPEGRIQVDGPEKQTIDNAVKYADYALGQYIEKARKSDYWKNTLFLIIADHSDKVYGTAPVPVRHFHIPALILGGKIKPRLYQPVASQIDTLPTLLSLMGIDNENPAIGHDLSQSILQKNTVYKGRAIMQFGGSQAYMEGNHVAILQKGQPVSEYIYKNELLTPVNTVDTDLRDKALAHAIWTINTYRNFKYKQGKSSSISTKKLTFN
ncbi:MAG TPA: LTA synthase family protein [Gammaproteobacteria bacterium]|nr:LTA synthase family protein [Gammaproteobacteria bacterium]